MMSMMRTFLAVTPPGDAARDIHHTYEPFRKAWSGVKWVNPLQYHITLVFLGETEASLADKIKDALGPILCSSRAFEIAFEGPGYFGSACSPRLFFLKVGKGADELERIRRDIQPVLENLLPWEERTYKPHLTLGRPRRRGLKGPADGSLLLPGMKRDNVGAFRAGEVRLYRSILKPEGAEYSIMETWPLKEAL